MLCILRRSLRPHSPDRTGWNECRSADMDLTSHPSSGWRHASPPPPRSLFLLRPLPGHPCPGSSPCSHHLPQVSPFRRGKPPSISSLHLILPGPSSQRLPGIHTAPATAPCLNSPDRQETPGGGSVSCSWLCPQHPGQRLRLHSHWKALAINCNINTDQLTDASALGFLNPRAFY